MSSSWAIEVNSSAGQHFNRCDLWQLWRAALPGPEQRDSGMYGERPNHQLHPNGNGGATLAVASG